MALVDTLTGEIVSDLTRAEARDLTDTIKGNVDSLWSLLMESHERKAWAALGYSSWREYATTEFGMSQSHAYRLLDQAKVIAEIEAAADSPVGEFLSEREARDLKHHLNEAKQAVEEATKGATSEADKQERARQALDNLRSTLVERTRPTAPRPSGKSDQLDTAESDTKQEPTHPGLTAEEQRAKDIADSHKRSARYITSLTDDWSYFWTFLCGKDRAEIEAHLAAPTLDVIAGIEEQIRAYN